MGIILAMLGSGMMLGYLLRRQQQLMGLLAAVTTWAVYLLVFFLGTSVGGSQVVMQTLRQLGWQALVLSIGGILGSVLVSGLIYGYFFDDIGVTDEK